MTPELLNPSPPHHVQQGEVGDGAARGHTWELRHCAVAQPTQPGATCAPPPVLHTPRPAPRAPRPVLHTPRPAPRAPAPRAPHPVIHTSRPVLGTSEPKPGIPIQILHT